MVNTTLIIGLSFTMVSQTSAWWGQLFFRLTIKDYSKHVTCSVAASDLAERASKREEYKTFSRANLSTSSFSSQYEQRKTNFLIKSVPVRSPLSSWQCVAL
jgi:hypothetical protein